MAALQMISKSGKYLYAAKVAAPLRECAMMLGGWGEVVSSLADL